MDGAIQGPTEVLPVGSKAQMRKFIRCPFTRYRDHPNCVPPLLMAEKEQFDRKNSFFEHARVELFSATEPARSWDASRPSTTKTTTGPTATTSPSSVSSRARIRTRRWPCSSRSRVGRALGRRAVRGPVNPSLNHSAGFVIYSLGTDPFVMMPYNPPEYSLYVEPTGYGKAKDLYAWIFARGWDITKLSRLAERVLKRHGNLVIRPVDMKRWHEELERFRVLYNRARERNWGFVRYTNAEFDQLARGFKMILDPELVALVEVHGELAGSTVVLPDANQVLKRMGGDFSSSASSTS